MRDFLAGPRGPFSPYFRLVAALIALGLALLLLLGLAEAAHAAGAPTANVSWTAPTQYTDGVALPASDIAFYTVTACEVSSPATCLTAKVNAPAVTLSNMPLVCGQYDFTVTVTTGPTATRPNLTSAPSNTVPFATSVACLPNAPGGLSVTPGATG